MDNRSFDGSRIIVEYAGIRRDRRKGPSSEDLCYNCHNPGHWYFLRRANECKQEDCRGKCYRCGGTGHIRRDCKASRSRSPKRSPANKTPPKKEPSPYSDDSKPKYYVGSDQEYEA